MLLEVCTDTLSSSIIAENAGADRIELCADLCVGGTTPSAGLIQLVKSHLKIPIAVMIRPRSGDFCYNEEELATMKADIDVAKGLGAEAVVFGVLTPDGEIDTCAMRSLIACARPMEVVCHRAFDMTKDPYHSLRVLISLGVDRLLTSGFANKAYLGLEILYGLVKASDSNITIVVGSGVSSDNILELIHKSQAKEYHMSGKRMIKSHMKFRKEGISMGSATTENEYTLEEASFEKIKKTKDLLKTYKKPIP
jgi:copper homeostasis protein